MRALKELMNGISLGAERGTYRNRNPQTLTTRELDDLAIDYALEYLDTGSEAAHVAYSELYIQHRQSRPRGINVPCECHNNPNYCDSLAAFHPKREEPTDA